MRLIQEKLASEAKLYYFETSSTRLALTITLFGRFAPETQLLYTLPISYI